MSQPSTSSRTRSRWCHALGIWGPVLLLLCGWAVAAEPAAGVPTDDDAQILKRVATHLRTLTTARGGDQVQVNEYNGWYYQTLMVLEGMERTAAVVPNSAFQGYTAARVAALADLVAKGKDAGNSHMRHYRTWRELWCTGLGHLWLERALAAPQTTDSPFQDYRKRFADFVDQVPRVDGGLLANVNTQVRTDDAYLMVPAMLRLADLEGSDARREDAISQLLGFHRRLFQTEDDLYRHIWDAKNDTYAAAYWGRGNGWMALAYVNVLAYLPKTHPRWPAVRAAFQAQMAGVRRHQAPEGGWRQVLDHPESWIETSCTGMFTYALARGVGEGWLDPSYREDARRGWAVLRTRVQADGSTIDTCPATGPGKLEHYLNRPRKADDPHSHGPILLAGSEIIRLGRNQP